MRACRLEQLVKQMPSAMNSFHNAREKWGTAAVLTGLLLLLAPATSAVQAHAFTVDRIFSPSTGPSTYPQPHVSDPKLSVAFWDAPTDGSIPVDEEGMESVTMTNSKGQKFKCILPKLPSDGSVSDSDGADATSDATLAVGSGGERRNEETSRRQLTPEGMFGDSSGTRKSVEELLDQFKGAPCFLRMEGWWIYEICYKSHVRQFHAETDANGRNVVTQSFFLGFYDEEASVVAREKYDGLFEQKEVKRFHTHAYINGTECDLTGAPRRTEVKYVCSDSGMNQIVAKEEPATCSYEFTMETTLVCSHRLFRKVKQPVHFINCHAFPLEGGGEQGEGREADDNGRTKDQDLSTSGVLVGGDAEEIVGENVQLEENEDADDEVDEMISFFEVDPDEQIVEELQQL